jgi:hypothetical protein
MIPMDSFLEAAISEARQGLREGGIPIGSVIVHGGKIIGREHNRRVSRCTQGRQSQNNLQPGTRACIYETSQPLDCGERQQEKGTRC